MCVVSIKWCVQCLWTCTMLWMRMQSSEQYNSSLLNHHSTETDAFHWFSTLIRTRHCKEMQSLNFHALMWPYIPCMELGCRGNGLSAFLVSTFFCLTVEDALGLDGMGACTMRSPVVHVISCLCKIDDTNVDPVESSTWSCNVMGSKQNGNRIISLAHIL